MILKTGQEFSLPDPFRLNLQKPVTTMNQELVEQINKLLVKAGRAIVEVYRSNDFAAETKADHSPVTRADKISSRILNEGLEKMFPGIPVMDEEKYIPDHSVRSKWTQYFVIDPLDGTKEFIKQNGEFCINLALIQGTSPELGWIYQPLAETGWFCERGKGIIEFNKNIESIQLSRPYTKRATIRIAASRSFFKPREAELIDKIKQKFEVEILHCGSSKKQVQMIKGNADMYLKAGPCSEWDTAPGQLMVEEFGGAVLRHDSFEALQYNREDLRNPPFVMLNERLNTPEFLAFMKRIINE